MISAFGRAAAFRLFLRAVDDGAVGDRAVAARAALGDHRVLSFARGLSFGALIGAAIAGLGIWTRLRHRTS